MLLSANCFGQDIHFSQADLSPLNLNPASAGMFNSEYRLHINERSQWRSVTVPYKTFSTSFDASLRKIPYLKENYAGAGIVFNNDRAGDGNFGTNQIKLCLAYHHKIKNDTGMVISAGFNIAYNQHSVDYTKFYFGNQYNGMAYDPSIQSNEFFGTENMSYFDASIGVVLNYAYKNMPYEAGISFHHLNKPQQSFLENISVELDRKFTFHFISEIKISDNLSVNPNLFWFRQGRFNELNMGGLVRRKLNSLTFRAIYFGGWFRFKDAGIACFAFDYQNFRVGISYDINISSLTAASNGRGGLEISLRYIFGKAGKTLIPGKHICPPYL